ncbi:hypothetical protein DTO212C5_9143 [Paecilomyces variotii]|nr:hypothetical protein DTO212C5_9143 [Paecilomyces variotii]
MSSSAFRGRARTYGNPFQRDSTSWIQKRNIQQTPPPPLGEIIATIYQSDLQADKGEPPSWTPLSTPTKLKEDSGVYYRDPNAARYASYPMEPMVQAILAHKPDFSLQSVDIVACGSTLEYLLRFIRGEDKSFRILVEVVGTTVFFMRRENSPDEVIPDIHGYGHTFPEAYTTWSAKVKGFESHQRVMKYDFAGMSCLVRFGADYYLPPPTQNYSSRSSGEDPTEVEDNLLSSIERATISNVPSSGGSKRDPKSLKISAGGERISQSAIFDLKTRSIRKKDEDTLDIELPRLWISQIPNFILITQWEEDQQASLAKFAELLNKIVSFARSSESGRFEITHEDSAAVLELRAQCADAGRVLPASVAKEWSDQVLDSDGDSSDDSFLDDYYGHLVSRD